jgi:hypothetical protein
LRAGDDTPVAGSHSTADIAALNESRTSIQLEPLAVAEVPSSATSELVPRLRLLRLGTREVAQLGVGLTQHG